MKALILFSASLIFSLSASGQKCRFTVDKKDEFTGEKVNSIVRKNSGWTWISSKKGGKYLIDMTFLSAGEVQKPMTTNDSVLIKFVDGTILHLRPVTEVAPAGGAISISTTSTSGSSSSRYTGRGVTQTSSVTSFSPTFEVDRGVYEKLSQSLITIIRFDFAGKPFDFDLTKKPLSKSAPDLMNDAKCILILN